MIRRFSLIKNQKSIISSSSTAFIVTRVRFCSSLSHEDQSSSSSSPNNNNNNKQRPRQQHQNHHSTHVTDSSSTLLPGMVDVSGKALTDREATAIGHIWFPPSVAKIMLHQQQQPYSDNDENKDNNNNNNNKHGGNNILEFCTKKGPIFTTATIAATQAAKQTSNTIPFCHPIPIRKCTVEWSL